LDDFAVSRLRLLSMGGTVSSCASLSALLGTFGTVVVVKNRGYPKSWRVYFMENPWKKMNDNWGYPDFSGNHHVVNLYPEKLGFQPQKYMDLTIQNMDLTVKNMWISQISSGGLTSTTTSFFGRKKICLGSGLDHSKGEKNLLFN